MKKTNLQKGITLIALIITIVILLILAVVAISAVQDSDIIAYAQNATDGYQEAQDKEQDLLDYYGSYLSGTVGKWKQEGATLTKTNEDGTKTQIKIGDYVNYNEGRYTHTPDTAKGAGTSNKSGSESTGYTLATSGLKTENLSWRVLGVSKKGELELISADQTSQTLYLANDEGYVNAVTTYNEDGSVKELGTLDAYCNDLYGQGKDSEGNKVATGARSLNAEDINKLTNYDPKTYSEYGDKTIFKYPTDKEVSASTTGLTKNMWYKKEKIDGTLKKDWTNITSSSYQTFRLPEENTAISSENPGSKEVTSTFYCNDIQEILTTEDGYTSEEVTEIRNMLTKGSTGTTYVSSWLASKMVSTTMFYGRYNAAFGVTCISYGVFCNELFYSSESFFCQNHKVRPVVTLSSDCYLAGSGTDVGSSSNMWNIIRK